MQVGNARYLTESDLPETLALFPLSGVLLLSGGHLPLNIFEPRYLALIDDALKGNRLIGVIQPVFSETIESPEGTPELCKVGTIGRITTDGVITNYSDPRVNGPYGITFGPGGNMWFTNGGNNTIRRRRTRP